MAVTDEALHEIAERLRDATSAPPPVGGDLRRMVCVALGVPYASDFDSVMARMLADLIDPGDAPNRSEATPKCDREALLALADEMEIDGARALDDGDWCKPLPVEYAHRISEACGEVVA